MSVRRRALDALNDITWRGAYANLRLKEAEAGLDQRDAKWVAAAVYTAIENLSRLDGAIDGSARGKLDKTVRGILRLGLTEAFFMNTPASAACNESVKLAKETGKGALSGYVNAVMRAATAKGLPELTGSFAEKLGAEFGYPVWLVEEYASLYGEAFARAIVSYRPTGMTIRAQRPYTATELERELVTRKTAYERGKLDPEAFRVGGFDVVNDPLFCSGRIAVQSESAMLVCRAVMPYPGIRVLDACSAPGGKSAYMASISGDCSLTCLDVHPHRVELIRKTLERLHVERAELKTADASVYDEALDSSFDAVLVDAPCSGFGVTGKPDARQRRTSDDVDALCGIQSRLLEACSRYVRPGGALVYSTCTVSQRENGCVLERFLDAHPGFSPGRTDWLPEALRDRASGGGIQLFPNTDGTEGFFIARLERKIQ